MSRLNEYNPDFGVVFEDEWDKWRDKYLGGGGGGGGTKPPTTTPTTPPTSFSQQALQDKTQTYSQAPGFFTTAQLAAVPGARQTNANTIITGQGEKYSLQAGTGLWQAFGTANQADRQQYLGAAPLAGSTPTTTPSTTPSASATQGAAGLRQYAGLSGLAGTGGTLTSEQTPQLPSFASSTLAGYGVPQQGRQYMYSGEGLNQLGVNPLGTTNGPVVQAPGQRAPASMGFGAGVNTNMIQFSQRPGGTVEAERQFPSVPVSVPSGYRPGPSGFSMPDDGGAFRSFAIPINAGPQGTGFAHLTGPTTMQIGNTGYLTSGMPYNDPFMVYGRQGSADAATRAVQMAQLANERNTLMGMGYSPATIINALSAVREGPGVGDLRDYFPGSAAPLPGMMGYATATPGAVSAWDTAKAAVGGTATPQAPAASNGGGVFGTGFMGDAWAAAVAAARNKEEEERGGFGSAQRSYE